MQQDNVLTNMITLLNGVTPIMVSLMVQNGQTPTLSGMMLKVTMYLNMAEKSLSLVEMVRYSTDIDQTLKNMS